MLEGPDVLDLLPREEQELVPTDHLVVVVEGASAGQFPQTRRVEGGGRLQGEFVYDRRVIDDLRVFKLVEHKGLFLNDKDILLMLVRHLHLLQNVQTSERRETLPDREKEGLLGQMHDF